MNDMRKVKVMQKVWMHNGVLGDWETSFMPAYIVVYFYFVWFLSHKFRTRTSELILLFSPLLHVYTRIVDFSSPFSFLPFVTWLVSALFTLHSFIHQILESQSINITNLRLISNNQPATINNRHLDFFCESYCTVKEVLILKKLWRRYFAFQR